MVTKAQNGTDSIEIKDGFLNVHLKLGPGVISATGKSKVLVSTGGFKPIQGSDVRLNLIAIKKS